MQIAKSFVQRMTGLLNRKTIRANQALLIENCNSIHMFFMKFAIDAVFADSDHRVAGLCRKIKPFRVSPIFFKASYVIELPVGVIDATQTECGDQLALKP